MTIETKYNIGDNVWVINAPKCKQSIVHIIKIIKTPFDTHIEYFIAGKWRDEREVFSTKEELLKSL